MNAGLKKHEVAFSKTARTFETGNKKTHPTMQNRSPFPGMDPYLEGHLWPDVHHDLTSAIRELIAPQIAPRYVARVETYTVEDTSPEGEVGIIYPDVAVLQQRVRESSATYGDTLVATEPTIEVAARVTVRIPVVQIRDVQKNRLITAIEILSPVNKRKPGWQPYHEKRNDLHHSGVHLLELDLLRRGQHHLPDLRLPAHQYLFSLWRAGAQKISVWTNTVQQSLPVLPVPLRSPDPDVLLPLRQALDLIYQRGLYQLSIDYAKAPPPPEFSEEERAWMRTLATAATE